MKFKNYIETESGIKDTSTSPGTSGQVLSSTVTGTSWVDQSTINAGNAEHVVIYAKNTSGSQIDKGTPVYITGTVGATDTVEIAPADAGDSAKMPAVGLLDDTLINNAFGYVITGGFMDNITTDPIDTLTPSSNDTVYVKVGGGLTLTKPTGPTGLIQNVAKVGKVSSGNSGSLIVSSILRTNDVPNLTTGKIWVGDGNTVESTVVHLDEVNERMGIGTSSPSTSLHINADAPTLRLQDATSGDNHYLTGNNGELRVQSSGYITMRPGAAVSTTFLANGNVGIGTTSPSEKLHVAGNMRLENQLYDSTNSQGTSGQVLSKVSAGTQWIDGSAIPGVPDGSGTANYTARWIDTDTLGTGVLYDNGTNVGIGTASPTSAKLVVAGDVDVWNSTNTLLRSSHNGSYGSFQTFTGGLYGILALNPGGGNVGIGTISPNAKLEVAGSTRITGSGLDVGYGNNGTNFFQVGFGRTTNGFALIDLIGDSTYTDYGFRILRNDGGPNTDTDILHRGTGDLDLKTIDAGDIGFHTTSIQRMIVKSNGDVGIGTTSPGEKLEVNGTVKATDYKGYLPAFQHGGFYHSSSSSSSTIYWIPTNYFSEVTSSQYYNNWIAPYSGRVKKIVMRWASGTTPTATSVTFRYQVNSTTSASTFPATVTNGASTNMTATKAFGDTDITFNAGDRVLLGFTTDGGTRLLYGFAYTIVLEYNIT
jgi:hypothetical protein